MENKVIYQEMASQLKHYLETTPKEEVVKGWEETKEFDEVGVPMDEFLKPKPQNTMKLFLVNCTAIKNDIQYSVQQELHRNHIVHAETEDEAEEKVRNYWLSKNKENYSSYRIHIHYTEPAIL
jgi:hypothetical protein